MAFLPAAQAGRWAALCLLLSGACLCAAQSDISVACTQPLLITPQATPPAGTPAPAAAPAVKPMGKLATEETSISSRYSALQNTVTFSIVNNTAAPIESLSFSSKGLDDAKANQHLAGWSPHSPKLIAKDGVAPGEIGSFPKLDVNQRTDCTLTLPEIDSAGSYLGILRINGDGYEAPLPITIQARGPYAGKSSGSIPFWLMTLVFALGWSISVALDRWFTVKLPRAQQAVLLREALDTARNFGAELADWEKEHQAPVLNAKTNTALVQSELQELLKSVNTRPVADLQQAAQRYSTLSDLDSELFSALQIAGRTFSGADLAQKAAALDDVSMNLDLPTYRAALVQILTSPVTPPAAGAVAPGGGAHPRTPGIDLSTASASTIRTEIDFMDWAKILVTGAAVWISAYSVLYLGNPCFGATTDYLNLFLWSLGLSTTGNQVVAQIKRP